MPRQSVGSRASVVSSFTIIKGAMIGETYSAFGQWSDDASKAENLRRLRDENPIGAKSDNWLRDVAKVLNRRFDPAGRDRPLVQLARGGCDLEVWKPILLWHMTRDEFLVRDFLLHWVYPAFESGALRPQPRELEAWVRSAGKRGTTEHAWTEATLRRVAAGLLKMAADFGLLRATGAREFESFHLREASFLYLLHAMYDELKNPRRLLEAEDWRMYFMSARDVERELLRLHQFRKLEYHVAGSLVELRLPCRSAAEYAERMTA
ncbi:MAG TPA: BrxA family protein [Planctomycetota bacterium]|nr:BrxA family protein [Planctomycetota bacterium]